MAQLVVMGATVKCDKSVPQSPASLMLTPNTIDGKSKTVATIQDFAIKNIATFVTCTSTTNSAVIAAQGSPAPCLPKIAAPWSPGSSTVSIAGQPALTSDSKCMCMDGGGQITIDDPGQSDITTG